VRPSRRSGANALVGELAPAAADRRLHLADSRPPTDDGNGLWPSVIDAMPAHVAIVDPAGTIVAVNRAWRRFAEANGRAEIGPGWNYLGVCDRAAEAGDVNAAEAARLLRDVLASTAETVAHEYPCTGPGGRRWFRMRITPLQDGSGAVLVQHDDTTAEHLAQSETRLQARLLHEVDAAVGALDPSGRVVFWNRAAEELYGWTCEEVLGERLFDLLQSPDGDDLEERARELRRDGLWDGVVTLRRKDGRDIPVQLRSSAIRNAAGEIEWLIGIATDATERVRAETQLRTARDHMRAVAESIPEGLITLNEDGSVTYMNPKAERLLGWTAAELDGERLHDVALHATGDYDDWPITRARIENRQVEVSEDVFVCRSGGHLPVAFKASPFETADGTRGTVVVFRDITLEKQERERQKRELLDLTWAARVRDALTQGGFTLYAQPIVDLGSGEVVQHELLLRMHYAGEVVAPGEFVPAAERQKLMVDIDQWVLLEAARLASRGHHLHFNLSADSLSRPEMFAQVQSSLATAEADPARLVIEITETSLVENEATAAQLLERLATIGCEIALDDFGTGYGGFTYLKRLPVQYLKIDREFVRDATSNASSRAVVEAIVSLARAFGQKTIAEGIEDRETMALMSETGVDYGQGFLFGRPAPASELLDL
jgi:PAS domain S-box-containing protein